MPSFLISGGVYIHHTSGQLSRYNLQQKILTRYPNSQTHLDDYLPFIPIGQMYLGKALGMKSKNNYFNQSKQLFFSQFFTSILTHTLKRTTQVTRPDQTPHAFPSGHTSMAFSSASTLFYEYKTHHPVYAYSGFIFASATGGLRVLNNRHWVSDVLVGAGIAILTTHLVYHFEPLKNWNPFNKNNNTSTRNFY
ncbi:MAG: phosphatase PAP2 family protein [Flavobacteriales bacterium]|nr:phosphatase PAP2 family protein [Flavobacteriales bacterium]